MFFATIVLLETLAASVAARSIVVSPDLSPDLSKTWSPIFRHGTGYSAVNIEAGDEDELDLQPRAEAVVDVPGLDNQDAGMPNQHYDEETTHAPPNNLLSIAPRANTKPSKAQKQADDKKFHRDQLKPNDAKYINNLDKQNDKKCGTSCQNSLNSHRSEQSKLQKERERTAKTLPGSRASRGEVNTKKDDYNHDLNHLRQDRGDIGPNGLKSLDSWHSVESANSKASKASRAKKAAEKGGNNHG
ncbi:hypothetical protein CKAH01_12748 [Colletotrichum kahawae]|uniref:Uncharacterized protein n=1 Tax=Colletotrichum kahawae TaxID=34407 RepID=A0AAE0DEX7_COLKA|nr:hypothetical protein CKAH01_12748 [Colletotrichum kahawae]